MAFDKWQKYLMKMFDRRKNIIMIIRFSLFLVLIMITVCCKNPSRPEGEEFPIYVGTLRQGFDIGVEDSQRQRDWLIDKGDFMQMAYPGYADSGGSGSVFFVAGAVPLEEVAEDFSNFKSLAVDLKGELGREDVMITIEEKQKSSCIFKYFYGLNKNWQTCVISLSEFSDVDPSQLHTVIKFAFHGPCAQTVYFKNVKYYHRDYKPPLLSEYPVYMGDSLGYMLAPGYDIGVNTGPDSLKNWFFDECGIMKMVYPPNQQWGVVFIYNKGPQDFSGYETLSVELKGEVGGEIVYIEIGDTLSTDLSQMDHPIKVTNAWQVNDTTLSFFTRKGIDLTKLRIVAEFFFWGPESQTVYFRNVKYLR